MRNCLVGAGKKRNRETTVPAARLHQTNWNHGNARCVTGERGIEDAESEDARTSASQDGPRRHRLPEVTRRFLQVANETEDDHHG